MNELTGRSPSESPVPDPPFDPWPTEADLYHCFRLLLGRNPDESGWRAYGGALPTTPLTSLVEMFVCSEEFRSQPAYQALVGHDHQVELELVELDRRKMWVDPTDLLVAPLLGGAGWEPDVSAAMERILEPGWTVIDIGANVGYFTLLAASRVGPTGHVIAFEPGQANCGLIQLSAITNEFDNVRVHSIALSDVAGAMIYERFVGTNARVHPVDKGQPPSVGGPRQLVPSMRLDDIQLEAGVDLIKIDIEGGEMRALEGGLRLLRESRPLIVTEFSPPALREVSGVSGEDYLELFAGVGYDDLAVIQSDGSTISYGLDTSAVVAEWKASARDHLDLLVTG